MSIANVKQELIQAGCDNDCINECFGNHTDIKDVTKAASDMMFQCVRQNNKEKAAQFKIIAKALNERIATKKDLIESKTMVSARDQTIVDLTSKMSALSRQLEEMQRLLKEKDMSIQEQSLLIDQQKQTISSTESVCQQLRVSLEAKTLEAQANEKEATKWKEMFDFVDTNNE